MIKLIVGLANPGREYHQTRHNAGAWFISELLKPLNEKLKLEPKFHGYTNKIMLEGKEIRLLIPNTFMNLSGKSVIAIANFYQIPAENILIAHDELDLLPGIAKFKLGGQSGGHNGIKDIQQKLGNTHPFYRLRIGIGHPGDKNRVTGFVLGKPSQEESILIHLAIDKAVECTKLWLREGLTSAMNELHAFRADKK